MKYTKAYTTERAHQVEEYIDSKLSLNASNFSDNYPDDLKELKKDAIYCDFEKLQRVFDEIDQYIESLASYDISDLWD